MKGATARRTDLKHSASVCYETVERSGERRNVEADPVLYLHIEDGRSASWLALDTSGAIDDLEPFLEAHIMVSACDHLVLASRRDVPLALLEEALRNGPEGGAV